MIPAHVQRMFDAETKLREAAIGYSKSLYDFRESVPENRKKAREAMNMAASGLRNAASEFDRACRRVPAVEIQSEATAEEPTT